MGLDIFFLEDIRNALLAADEGSSSAVAVAARLIGDPVELRAYREGYKDALCTVALAFGISPQVVAWPLAEPGADPVEVVGFEVVGDQE